MSFTISSSRLAGLALGLALLLDPHAHGMILHGTTVVQVNTGPNTNPSKSLTPEVKAMIKELLAKVKVEKEKAWNTRMETEIADLTKAVGLNDAQARSLADPARQAAHAGVDAWAATKMDDQIQTQLAMMPPAQVTLMLNQLMANIAAYANTDWGNGAGNINEPYEQDVWIKALHQVLTPEQMAAWDKTLADRKVAVEKEVADAMKNSLDRVRMQGTQAMKSRTDAIETALNLPKDRSDKLEAAAKTAVDQGTEMWRRRVEKIILSMGEAQRKQFSVGGNIFFGTEPSEVPDQQPAWKDALATLLTPAETARLKSAQDDRRAQRVHVMGQIMITLIDDQVALTEAQRRKLGPLADRLIKDVSELYPENGAVSYFAYQPAIFFAAADKATNADLKPILDATQLRHWRETSHTDTPPAATATDKQPDDATAPEAIERAISHYLYRKTEAERKLENAKNVLMAEDAIRVLGLGAETAARLEIAARGMTEEYLTSWKWMVEQQVRSQLQQGVTPQNIKERLAGMQDTFFGGNMGGNGWQLASVWDETVKTALTAQQQQAWQKETEARTTFHDQAIAGLVMAEFDRKVWLSDSQRAKLTPIITGVVHDSSPEIGQMFSNVNNAPWFLMSQFLMVPFAGIDDNQLKSILTKDQLDIWRGDQDYVNATSWWQNIKQLHLQRLQQEERMKKQTMPR